METEVVKISKIKKNPNNPRLVKDDKFKKLVQSIKDFPEMLKIRPIVVNEDMVVLGGNMRLRACKDAGLKDVPIIQASELTEKQQREFIIKDNVGFGEWDWDMIANEWDAEQLDDWGLDMPGFDFDSDELNVDFNINSDEKLPIQTMTFVLADEQSERVKMYLSEIKATDEYKYCETFGNENSNGNALYLILHQWAEQRR